MGSTLLKTRTGCPTCRYVPSRRGILLLTPFLLSLTQFLLPLTQFLDVSIVLDISPSSVLTLLCPLVRHVKCDEQRPSCQKCLSTGRQCDGYAANYQDDPTYSSGYSSNSITPPALELQLIRAPSGGILGSEKECRAFHFFYRRSIPQLSGFFGSDFWDRLVLQVAHAEPAVRHAAMALGSVHERYENGDRSILRFGRKVDRGDFALQQYSIAIKQLLEPGLGQKRYAMEVYLTTCLIFICFEVRCFFRSGDFQ